MAPDYLDRAARAECAQLFAALQRQHPLVDCITNMVTVGDVANGLLAIDARPVMASAPEEIADFVARADALLLNLGATSSEHRRAMALGAAQANALDKPVVIDPVGIGTSSLRRETLHALLAERHIHVIRGNISEIKALAGSRTDAGGVDASPADLAGADAFASAVSMAQKLARRYDTVIAISGPRDIITDGDRTLVVHGGNITMTRVTGSGCTLTGVVAAFVAVAPEAPLLATATAIGLMCMAGDRALAACGDRATGSFRVAMFDALSALTPEDLAQDLRIEELGGNHDQRRTV
ncbi:MAG: hydroxyethylthiazole kinase [Peptococcaceae bacterium]|nr:hydroxyethylthiazole kinase [Peptococcaceae bacterium]